MSESNQPTVNSGPASNEAPNTKQPASDAATILPFDRADRAPPIDPFDPAALRIEDTTDTALGVEKPILVVPVMRPSSQMFFRVHPDPSMRLDMRVIELKVERETYAVTPVMAALLSGETRPVRLLTCLPRVGGGIFVWPLKLPRDDGRENNWNVTARKAAEIAEKKWTRIQSNMSLGAYDITTSVHIPDPVWPKTTMRDLLHLAFGDGRLIDRENHPVIRQLLGQA
jgi:hypothetical protein